MSMILNMKNNLIWGLMLVALSVFSGCNTITEFPDENEVDPTVINLDLKITMSEEISDWGSPVLTKSSADTMQQRLLVEIYKFNDLKTPFFTMDTVLDESLAVKKLEIPVSLNATKYRVAVWSDYVEPGDSADLYYNTGQSLKNITYKGEYIANTILEDCFAGKADIDLTPYSDQWNVSKDLEVKINRPVGQLRIISDDVKKYIDKINSNGGAITEEDITKFTAIIFYEGFSPIGYNAFDNVLNDATTGLQYTSKFSILNENEALIAFDYMFADAEGTSYSVALQLKDANGTIINEISGRKISLKCNEITILKDEFLTGDYKPGISIDTDYDGSIDVVLPD